MGDGKESYQASWGDLQNSGRDLREADSGTRSSNDDVRMELDEKKGGSSKERTGIKEVGVSQHQDKAIVDFEDFC